MNWNEVLEWSRMAFIACCALVLQMTVSLAVQAFGHAAANGPMH